MKDCVIKQTHTHKKKKTDKFKKKKKQKNGINGLSSRSKPKMHCLSPPATSQ